jgi:hypothetical protein
MRFELPERKKLTLEMVIPIRWGDMDAMSTTPSISGILSQFGLSGCTQWWARQIRTEKGR